jgi:ABC-type glycerol-3-phosphate transport system substrate-binding protein
MISKLILALIAVAAVSAASACDSDSSLDPTATLDGVVINSISPSSAVPGTEIVIEGSGFTAEENDIGFTHEDIDFQGSRTAFLNGIASPDGITLMFELPDTNDIPLAACSYSQLGPDVGCPDIGLLLPSGEVELAVFNADGTSNSVTFTVLDRE